MGSRIESFQTFTYLCIDKGGMNGSQKGWYGDPRSPKIVKDSLGTGTGYGKQATDRSRDDSLLLLLFREGVSTPASPFEDSAIRITVPLLPLLFVFEEEGGEEGIGEGNKKEKLELIKPSLFFSTSYRNL